MINDFVILSNLISVCHTENISSEKTIDLHIIHFVIVIRFLTPVVCLKKNFTVIMITNATTNDTKTMATTHSKYLLFGMATVISRSHALA